MAVSRTAFKGAGHSAGLSIWRVESFEPVPVPAEDAGVFYTGDSYVLLHTTSEESASKTHSVHFWLGASTSQDEAGTAAILAVELDDALEGRAKQYRQVQGSESKDFFALFPNGVHYREGGVKSGFKHAAKERTPQPTLHRVKATKHATVQEVALDVQSLNSGDIFILDLFSKLLLWNGKDANVLEKSKAREVLEAMKERRNPSPETIVVEEGETDDAAAGFYASLGASDPSNVSIQPAETVHADSHREAASPQLYKIFEKAEGPELDEVADTPLRNSLLQSDSNFVLVADGEVFVWHGGQAKAFGHAANLSIAQQLLQKLQLPPSTPVQLIKEGMEDQAFREHFDWLAPATPEVHLSGEKQRANVPSEAGEETVHTSEELDSAPRGNTALAAEAPTPADSSHDGADPKLLIDFGGCEVKSHETAAPAAELKERLEAAIESDEQPAVLSPKLEESHSAADKLGSANGKLETQDAVAPSKEEERQEPAASKIPGKLSKSQLISKDTGFVPLPQTADTQAAPKTPENLKFIPQKDVLPFDELKDMRADSGVDMTCKEDYLSPEEFKQVFGKTIAEFKAQPKWRQLQAKKSKGLF